MALVVTNILSNVSHLKSQLSEKAKNLSTLIEQQYEQLCKLVAQKEKADVELKALEHKKRLIDTDITNKNKLVASRRDEVEKKENESRIAEQEYNQAIKHEEEAEKTQRDATIGVSIGAVAFTVLTLGLGGPIAAAAVVGTAIGTTVHTENMETKRRLCRDEYNSVAESLKRAQQDLEKSEQEAAKLKISLQNKMNEIKFHEFLISNYCSAMKKLQAEKKCTQIEDRNFNYVYESINNLYDTIQSNCMDKYQDLESVKKAFEMVYNRLQKYGKSLNKEQFLLLDGQQKTLINEMNSNKASIEYDF